MRPARPVIVALDVDTADEARRIIAELRDEAAAFKIGLQLFTAAGPEFVREVAVDNKVFLDLKFHDIPNTVAKAGIAAAQLGVWMLNVHASGGGEMMRRTVEEVTNACSREGMDRPLIIAVTVLTSSDANTLRETGIETEVRSHVTTLAQLVEASGLDGVVASPLEIGAVKAATEASKFLVVTPGVRPRFATNDDQKRVMTPQEAVSAGADYLVIGRPILQASNRMSALQKIYDEIGIA